MHLRGFARETVELVPGILKMGQPSQMTLFRITHWNLFQSDNLEGGRRDASGGRDEEEDHVMSECH